jgi:hypothetical protein
MNEALEEIFDVLRDHNKDGFEVPAVRVPDDDMLELLTSASFIRAHSRNNIELEKENAIGMVAGTEVIPDSSISAVVADDVKLKQNNLNND